MPHDHPGFDYWEVDDAAHRFPIDEIRLDMDDEETAAATVEMTPPKALPKPATVAERSVGIAHSSQLWFALECVRNLQGQIVYEGVFRGRHLHWHADHGENAPGPIQEIRLSANDMAMWGRQERIAAHGPHCDLFVANWSVQQGTIRVELCVMHFKNTPAGFLELRENTRRESEWIPPLRPSGTTPVLPPQPQPEPDPVPEGAMVPVRPDGFLAKAVGFFKRLAWGLFG